MNFNRIRYYQCVDQSNESTLGKVYQLLYIDDTNPEMTFYYMSEGMKCNEQFIQLINGTEISPKTVFVEVSSPANKWKIEKHNIKPNIQQAKGADGMVYEIPDLSLTSTNGKEISAGKHVYFIPPKPTKLALPDLEAWRLSYIINTLNEGKELVMLEVLDNIPTYYLKMYVKRYQKPAASAPKPTPVPEPIVDEPEELCEPASTEEQTSYTLADDDLLEVTGANPVTKINQDFTNTQGYYTTDGSASFGTSGFSQVLSYNVTNPVLVTLSENKAIVKVNPDNKEETKVEIDGKEYTYTELLNIINNSKVHVPKLDSLSDDTVDFVKNLISRAVKCDAVTTIDIVMELPAISTYRLIYESYGPEIAAGFVRYLAGMVPYTTLVDALTTGLKEYYDVESGIVQDEPDNIENYDTNEPVQIFNTSDASNLL